MKADFSTGGLVKRRAARLAKLLTAAMCMGSMPSWCCEEAASGATLHQAKKISKFPPLSAFTFSLPRAAPQGPWSTSVDMGSARRRQTIRWPSMDTTRSFFLQARTRSARSYLRSRTAGRSRSQIPMVPLSAHSPSRCWHRLLARNLLRCWSGRQRSH